MRFNVQKSLLSEFRSLQNLLEEIPEDDVLDRQGLEIRAEEITRLLQSASGSIETRPRTQAALTFKGRPVIGTHGIFAEFGMKAVGGFSEAVAAVAASLTRPLKAMGPIPNRDQNQLLITDTAIGSFGFVLEENAHPSLLLDEPSPVEMALDKVQDLLKATTVEDDEKLADTVDELDQRAIDKVRDFVKTLADYEAVCAIQSKGKSFRFENADAVARSLRRISIDNFTEEDEVIEGSLLGILPNKRTFEFEIKGEERQIFGKIGKSIGNPSLLNLLVQQPISISVSTIRVGEGAPRYVLRSVIGHDF